MMELVMCLRITVWAYVVYLMWPGLTMVHHFVVAKFTKHYLVVEIDLK